MKICRAPVPVVLAILFLLLGTLSRPVHGQTPVRAIVLSWDGAVSEFVQELLRERKLPNLARLIAAGAFADSVVGVYPSKTAPGHASLWTGAPPSVHGISGNNVPRAPRSRFTILETISGFDSTSLQAEPLWMAVARSHRRAVVIQATQAWPFEPYVAGGRFGPGQEARLTLFEGYSGIVGRDGIVTAKRAPSRIAQGWSHLPGSLAQPREISFTIGSTRFLGLLLDDPDDPVNGYDTMWIGKSKDGREAKARLKTAEFKKGEGYTWTAPLEVEVKKQPAAVLLGLFDLKPDGSEFLLYFTQPAREFSSRPELLSPLRKAAGVFVGNGASDLYRRGALGPTIAQGGDGTAERRYLETARLAQRQLMDATRWSMENLGWDLLLSYLPYPDEAEHHWRGYLERDLPGHRPDVAEKLKPFLAEVYEMCDEFLGVLMRGRPKNAVVALVSDHGMEGVNKSVRINAALVKAGLLALDDRGQVDLAKTRAFYPPANNAYILLNTTDRRGGIVRPDERAELISKIRRALDELNDGGRRVVTGIFDAQTEDMGMGIGGEAGGDVYIDLLPGYGFDARVTSGQILGLEPNGMHLFHPARKSMRTIMALEGPGVARNQVIREARIVDFAPTLAHLMGAATPKHATGRVLSDALSP